MTGQSDNAQMRRRTIKSCTACKQSKVRCDADGKVGKVCTRCRMRGLECEVDAHFKRTPVRERMKAMAAELKQLRQTVKEGEISPNRPPSQVTSNVERVSNNNASAPRSPEFFQNPFTMPPQQLGLVEERQQIPVQPTSFGPIVFSVEEIHECFRVYNEHFHQHIPIVNQTTSIGALQKCSPVLFKTILVIVCQRYGPLERSQHDFQILSEVYQQMLSQSILSSPLSLHTIQAILLICAWPLPTPYQLAEPSWLYCGVAMSAASYLNLGRFTHKPLYQGGQLSFADVENMSRTWISLFVISTNIATFIGAPLPFKHPSDVAGIEARIARTELPYDSVGHAALAVIGAKHGGILSPETDLVTHAALVAMHSEEMDGVARKYQDVWNDSLEFFLQAGKLHLHTSLWIRGTGVPDESQDTRPVHPSSETLIAATTAACRLIEIYDRLVGMTSTPLSGSALPKSTIAAMLPKNYFRCLIHAAAFLLRFVCFNKTAREEDRNLARSHIDMAITTLRNTAQESNPKHDTSRAAEVLEKLIEHGDLLQEQRLQINDRGGASIYWDVIHKSLQIRGLSTTRTDLMELIDPTRAIRPQDDDINKRRDSHMPTPPTAAFLAQTAGAAGGEVATSTELWDESLMQFFDLNMFDIGELSSSAAAVAGG